MLTERERKSAKVKFINWKKKTELEVSGKELKEHKVIMVHISKNL